MSTTMSIIDNIKQILATNNEETIINTINKINPVILMHYQLNIDSALEYYNNKLPKEHFNIFNVETDEVPDNNNEYLLIDDEEELEFNYNKCYQIEQTTREILLELGNVQLVQHYYDKYVKYLHCSKIFLDIATKFIKNNDFDSIKNIYPKIINENFLIYELLGQNNIEMLGQVLNIPNIDFDIIKFFKNNSGHIINRYNIDIIKQIYQLSLNSENPFFDINMILNAALVDGNEIIMQFALYNGATFEIDTTDGIYKDTIIYAIVGNNIKCCQTIIDLFVDKTEDKNWIHYFLLAAIYGTPEIIIYLLLHKPYMVEQIDNLYNKILNGALCNGNIECFKFAIANGATFNKEHLFVFSKNFFHIIYIRSLEADINSYGIGFHNKIITLQQNRIELNKQCFEYIDENKSI
jgi:hypothetical protein